MTLVVAYCDGKHISCISDTALTIQNESFRSEPWRGSLKSLIIDKHRFISFAGAADNALNIIRNIWLLNNQMQGNLPTTAILQICLNLRSTLTVATRPDFIIGTISPSEAKLYRIASDSIEENLQVAWIGSKEAFGFYQEIFHENKKHNQSSVSEEHILARLAMFEALDNLIDNDKDNSVGGFVIPLHSNKTHELEYFIHSGIYGMKLPNDTKPNQWNTLRFSNAVEGGYAYSLLAPKELGVAAVGVFILQAQLTIVFCPMITINQLVKGANQRAAIALIKEHFGFELTGILFD